MKSYRDENIEHKTFLYFLSVYAIHPNIITLVKCEVKLHKSFEIAKGSLRVT